MANTKRIPTFTSAITIGTPKSVLPNGTTAIVMMAGITAKHGASQ